MKLSALIPIGNLKDREITGVTCDSRQIKEGFAFVCIKGSLNDGHKYAASAAEKGAAVIVAQEDTGLDNQIIVPDTHAAYSQMCANWFSNPAKDLKLIGVTGTNGKTSVTYMLKKVLEAAGYKVGLIGTIQNMICDEIIATENTTPNAYDLNSLFALMKAKGCTYAIMEVSSHALDQCRVYNLDFDVAMFTNLTQDHLDYHGTIEEYKACKKVLFFNCDNAVVNADDEASAYMVEGVPCNVKTYALNNDADFKADNAELFSDRVQYDLSGEKVVFGTPGDFSVYNSLCAIGAVCSLGFDLSDVISANSPSSR